MMTTIEEYLEALKREMQGSDAALIQDALADAREHLVMALEAARQAPNFSSDSAALQIIIEEYGTPEETALAYKTIERRLSPPPVQKKAEQSFWKRLFGVYTDPRTWGSLLYMFIAFVTGILYFTWVVTGLSLSVGLMILIIGIPIALVFLLSVKGVALLEGRLVEALLGERMPRRPLFSQPGLGFMQRFKSLLGDQQTWLSMLYMFLQLPIGTFYFILAVTLNSLGLALLVAPVFQMITKIPIIYLGNGGILLPPWLLVLCMFGGLAILTLSMHLVRAIGAVHGRYAKQLLVR
ncbi:MAG: sensor domain-containing protein [Anaerolineaceae bacterium]|nr:sensor domain-containing protein [Anaerolineaceae bacterium]